jgi:hypothetical protein
MQMNRYPSLVLAALLAAAGCAPAAPPAAPAPAVTDTVHRHLRPVPATNAYRAGLAAGTRSETGAPGAGYWQQRVDYRIEAELDPATTEVRGREWITYHNRSPHTLTTVVLNLYQNVFTETAVRNRVSPNTGGITLTRVAAQGEELPSLAAATMGVASPVAGAPRGYAVAGTLARLVLPRPLAPGETAELEVDWHFRVPPAGTYRTAWEDALGGRAFVVGQWYPQVAVYDDLRGWVADPYLGDGEFYLEYGDFDVSLTVPAGWLVGATGELRNPEEVLTAAARDRLALVAAADTVVRVVTEAEVDAGRATAAAGPGGRLTWRFHARDVRDFAFAASDRYVWDALRTELRDPAGGRRAVPVHALYRPGAPNWQEAARYGQHALRFFDDLLIPYIYPQMTIAEGSVGGMEYPQLMFIGKPAAAEALYSVIAHETMHQWFPMMVGQDEAAHMWMDEGKTVYYQDLARYDFHPGVDHFAVTRARYLAVAGTDAEVPVVRHADLINPYGARVIAHYTKPGTLMRSLAAVLGDSVFHHAIRTYAAEWLLKRPTPWDFFATFEQVSGQALDWFFYPWFFTTGVLDQAVESVEQTEGGVRIVLRDLGGVAVPTDLAVGMADGGVLRLEIPVTHWTDPPVRVLEADLPALGEVVRVEIDPDQVWPDVDRTNNVWVAGGG